MTQVRFGRTGGGLGCLVFGVFAAVAAYYILTGFFYLLLWAAPALFVLALVINWRAVLDTGQSMAKYFQKNPVTAIVLGILIFIGTGIQTTGIPALDQLGLWLIQGGFPLLALYVLLRALGYNQLARFKQSMQDQQQPYQAPEEEFVEFEELESRPKNMPPSETPLDPPPAAEKKESGSENPYKDMF